MTKHGLLESQPLLPKWLYPFVDYLCTISWVLRKSPTCLIVQVT
ncbi:hypothetical protein HanXRQr2_Chr03g0116501 [Helianthus annuus]|uniref:Uncharacterized protein n=1 Tax=Helianthus annuus TaxID=4232 RepID=A0A9K3NVL5_HELAN|nr:hypothetical protein HanXRQr2_Chr03g0116501 [Helianthus annuus]KAJ0944146.1 hypothetical protein HanPSC8_Chr03g0112891 [Helianthus annuus]